MAYTVGNNFPKKLL